MTSPDTLTIRYEGRDCYDIYFTDSDRFALLGEHIRALGFSSRRILIVADSNTASLYLPVVRTALLDCAAAIFHATFPAGEENKTLQTVSGLYRTLIEAGMERGDLIIALGGGVVGDITGFLAATYLRGVTFVQIPTTLLSMTDSSIGGKTGVDLDGYKNMVGAFHMPGLVYINIATLRTLNEREFSCGMAEIIKHGLIRDRDYDAWLKDRHDDILARKGDVLLKMIRRSAEIKGAVVEADPKEKGERRLLNYGHTIGHAIEKLSDFTLTHGACVALGSVAAAYIADAKGLLTASEVAGIKERFSSFGLPVRLKDIPDAAKIRDTETLLRVIHTDKKSDAGKIHFVLLDGIGSAHTDTSVSDDDIRAALKKLK